MVTKLVIGGHGLRKDGSFDSGATGLITKGEHKYMKENLFPAMKKFVPKGSDVVFFDEYNVYSYGNIVELAKKYGSDTQVIEVHYDAGDSSASGGHVIVHANYAPDELDLRLRDAIADNVGVRYTHKGHKGISGRSNLANVNRTAKANVNYRLIELGFGTNKKDVDMMLNHTDEYAKSLVEAILNVEVSEKPKEEYKPAPTVAPEPVKKNNIAKTTNSVVDYLNATGQNSSFNARRELAKRYGISNYSGTAKENKQLLNALRNGVKVEQPKPTAKGNQTTGSIVEYLNSIKVDSSYSNRAKLAKQYGISNYSGTASQNTQLLNKLRGGTDTKGSSFNANAIAKQILKGIDSKGKRIPNGHANRRKHFGLTSAQYEQVRNIVNKKA